MDLVAVRTFDSIAQHGQFQAAADELDITQQAASKRIATLERQLGVRLFSRTPRGVTLTVDGQAFLPHARELLRVAERAISAVTPGRRALRVDVVSRRVAPGTALHAFHQQHPDIELDVVTLVNSTADAALAEVATGTIDATFRSLRDTHREVPGGLSAERVIDDGIHVLVGPRHPLANAERLSPEDLVAHPIWMPGMVDAEPIGFYQDLAQAFGLTVDAVGPSFGYEALLAEIAESDRLATFIGEGTRFLWPESYDLRRIPIVGPTPAYPLFVIWRETNAHPALADLLDHLRAGHQARRDRDVWLPGWAR
ncbi:LysR family transcriptional regulator [Saccharopolyspora indica]|uniref:LysR family transcriptional regulator n=1 Tax=Saccharopolyspora indica TaxID=1229659 RepID=UPI0022EB4C7F|nr:LysR family transcriptional regulator [Saccharopolyspora indica]MDA3642514.1 LysR family transcriptional regulator [Saccharopolyspora indica]